MDKQPKREGGWGADEKKVVIERPTTKANIRGKYLSVSMQLVR